MRLRNTVQWRRKYAANRGLAVWSTRGQNELIRLGRIVYQTTGSFRISFSLNYVPSPEHAPPPSTSRIELFLLARSAVNVVVFTLLSINLSTVVAAVACSTGGSIIHTSLIVKATGVIVARKVIKAWIFAQVFIRTCLTISRVEPLRFQCCLATVTRQSIFLSNQHQRCSFWSIVKYYDVCILTLSL